MKNIGAFTIQAVHVNQFGISGDIGEPIRFVGQIDDSEIEVVKYDESLVDPDIFALSTMLRVGRPPMQGKWIR